MQFFKNKSINSNTDKFFNSINVHVYEKKHINGFKDLIRSVSHIDGVYIENATKLLYKTPEKKKEKKSLFDGDSFVWWRKYWKNMPAFEQKNDTALISAQIHFSTKKSMQIFADKIDQNINESTQYIHFPHSYNENLQKKVCISDNTLKPKYPIYIISKGRWESRLTVKALEKMQVPYRIVVEPQEYDQYAEVIDPKKILELPFSNLGQGSIPARNWVWQHSISEGYDWHWILDDNIRDFYRLHKNIKWRMKCPNGFRIIEEFVDRYKNIELSGMHYEMFIPRRREVDPFQLNTRVYSCLLIRNDLPFQWRGKYNEDTDLSLRVLKKGLCTVLFQSFLCDKMATMRMKGGNTEEVYKDTNNRREFAESLKEQHPNLVTITKKWGRWHHHVDYSGFKQTPILKENIDIPNQTNEFGMKLIEK